MLIGIPKEIKPEEYRIALLPQGVRLLTQLGHSVLVQKGAGIGAGYSDEDFELAGARAVLEADTVFQEAELIVKVKEPIEQEYDFFRDGLTLFCYLHSETRPALVELLLNRKTTAIAFENVRLEDGTFPLLAPMSIIAGQQAVFQGMQFLWNHRGGIGKSMVAYPGLEPPRVVVLGAGQAGLYAAKVAAALGADVAVFEISATRIQSIAAQLPANIHLLHIQTVALEPYIRAADMVINTATVPPNSSNHLIDRQMLSKMQQGAIIVDVTANLKGAVETIDHYSTHDEPVWEVDGIIHYAVTNIPGTVARTASQALSSAVLPYLVQLAEQGPVAALHNDAALLQGLTTISGILTWHQSGEFQNRNWCSPEVALNTLLGKEKSQE